MKVHVVATVLFLLFTQQSYAENLIPRSACKNTGVVRKQPHLKKFFDTPKKQVNRSWCYAFVASDILTAMSGFPISSVHTAAVYNDATYDQLKNNKEALDKRVNYFGKGKEMIYGGFLADALHKMKNEKHICLESHPL